MEEGPSTATKGVKTTTFYGWKYRHFVVEEDKSNL